MGQTSGVRMAALLLVGVASLGALAGCGDDDGDSVAADPTSSDSPTEPADTESSAPVSDLPDCATVWVAGETLPATYQGCNEDGTDVKADKKSCSFGKPIVTYGGTFYAVTGRVINEVADLETDKTYRQALSSCQA